jgi:hypothetical protein
MRRRTHLTADEWRRRLDECMAMVLAAPERFAPAVIWWARWRREWLTERGELDTPSSTTRSRCTEPVVRGAEQGKLF